MTRTFKRVPQSSATQRSGARLILEKSNADLGHKTDSWLEMLRGREGLIALLEKLGWAYQPVFLREIDMIM